MHSVPTISRVSSFKIRMSDLCYPIKPIICIFIIYNRHQPPKDQVPPWTPLKFHWSTSLMASVLLLVSREALLLLTLLYYPSRVTPCSSFQSLNPRATNLWIAALVHLIHQNSRMKISLRLMKCRRGPLHLHLWRPNTFLYSSTTFECLKPH